MQVLKHLLQAQQILIEHATERPPRLESSYSTAAAAAAGEISSTSCTVVTLR